MSKKNPQGFEVCSFRYRITVDSTTTGKIVIKQDTGDDRTSQTVVIDEDCIDILIEAIEAARRDCK